MTTGFIKKTKYLPFYVEGSVYDICWGAKEVHDDDNTEAEYVSFMVERFFHKPSLYELKTMFCNAKRFPSISEANEIAVKLGYSADSIMPWLRELLQRSIELYDKSKDVDNFTINDVDVWLDKDTRTGLLLRFQAEKAVGKIDTVLWYNGMQFPLVVDTAIQMLYAIEVYASQTYDKTAEHLAAVDKLASVDALIAYDYKAGYPAQLAF